VRPPSRVGRSASFGGRFSEPHPDRRNHELDGQGHRRTSAPLFQFTPSGSVGDIDTLAGNSRRLDNLRAGLDELYRMWF